MKWKQLRHNPCPVARTLSVVGDRWTLLILRDSFLGTRRFEDFQRQLGITRHLLSDRLHMLVEAGILQRKPYGEAGKRKEYHLTDKGRELHPILLAMWDYGSRWLPNDDTR